MFDDLFDDFFIDGETDSNTDDTHAWDTGVESDILSTGQPQDIFNTKDV